MQGLKAQPWFREKCRQDKGFAESYDCTRCKMSTTTLERQYRGCGYEPPLDGHLHLTVWQPPSGNDRVGYRGPEMTVCPGYSTNLNEVTEATLARSFAKMNALDHFCEGEIATPDLLYSMLILDSEFSALEAWLMVPAKDGGGGA